VKVEYYYKEYGGTWRGFYDSEAKGMYREFIGSFSSYGPINTFNHYESNLVLKLIETGLIKLFIYNPNKFSSINISNDLIFRIYSGISIID
jgi:hypothetical protein